MLLYLHIFSIFLDPLESLFLWGGLFIAACALFTALCFCIPKGCEPNIVLLFKGFLCFLGIAFLDFFVFSFCGNKWPAQIHWLKWVDIFLMIIAFFLQSKAMHSILASLFASLFQIIVGYVLFIILTIVGGIFSLFSPIFGYFFVDPILELGESINEDPSTIFVVLYAIGMILLTIVLLILFAKPLMTVCHIIGVFLSFFSPSESDGEDDEYFPPRQSPLYIRDSTGFHKVKQNGANSYYYEDAHGHEVNIYHDSFGSYKTEDGDNVDIRHDFWNVR